MSKLAFDQDGQRLYFNGVDHCALFVKSAAGTYGQGVAWNGISNATVTPDGGDANDIYADNIKYLSIPGNVNINASITAYTYPDEFNACMGLGKKSDAEGLLFGQQDRLKFGLVFRSKIGNDNSASYGYVLNILYNCLASPTELSSDTVNESLEAAELSFDITTVPLAETDMPSGLKPTSWVRIECKPGGLLYGTGETIPEGKSVGDPKPKLQNLLDALYGTDGSGQETGTAPTFKTPTEIYTILKD